MRQEPVGAEQALLGFDAREMFLPPDASWDGERRGTYLLRSEVQKPLSVDPTVWPSLFGDGLPQSERTAIGLDALDLPAWRGPNHGLWDDLARMRGALQSLASLKHWTVAVGWVSLNGFEKPSVLPGLGPHRAPVVPPTIDDQWQLLGFDVADAGAISGLSNCGYGPPESDSLRASWPADLNEHHLFSEVTRAFAFRDLTDRRVPEHAPFFVYSLWLVERQPRGG